jgi:hypothetical protein
MGTVKRLSRRVLLLRPEHLVRQPVRPEIRR